LLKNLSADATVAGIVNNIFQANTYIWK